MKKTKKLIPKKYKQLVLLTLIITALVLLIIINKLTFFIYFSLSAIGGIITGYFLFKVWWKIQGKKEQEKLWSQPIFEDSTTGELIFWDELSRTKQQEIKKFLKNPPARYFFNCCDPLLSHAIFEPNYLQTLLVKRTQFLNPHEIRLNTYDPIKIFYSTSFYTSKKAWMAKRYKCSIKQIYSRKELVCLFKLSSEEENSLVRDKSVENILQSKINHHE